MRTLIFIACLFTTPALAGSPCDGIPVFDSPLAAKPQVFVMHPDTIRLTCDPDFNLSAVFACADEIENVVYLTNSRYLSEVLHWSETDIACLSDHEFAHLWHEDGTRWAGDHRNVVAR